MNEKYVSKIDILSVILFTERDPLSFSISFGSCLVWKHFKLDLHFPFKNSVWKVGAQCLPLPLLLPPPKTSNIFETLMATSANTKICLITDSQVGRKKTKNKWLARWSFKVLWPFLGKQNWSLNIHILKKLRSFAVDQYQIIVINFYWVIFICKLLCLC